MDIWVVSSLGYYEWHSHERSCTVFMWTYVSISLGYIPRSRIQQFHIVTLVSMLRRPACGYHFIPISNIWRSKLPSSSPTRVLVCHFDYSHISGCKIESHCDFDLHFPNDGCWASFCVLINHLSNFLGELSLEFSRDHLPPFQLSCLSFYY
jgi:hypothetical protein